MEVVKQNSRGVQVRVIDGELWVASPHSMRGYLKKEVTCDGWIPTGDLVELRDGRLFVLGRKEGVINVAGNKVLPVEVERVIRSVPGVLEARVYGARNPITGQLVRADIVPVPGESTEELRGSILRECSLTLRPYEVPRLLEFVEQIPAAVSGKAASNHG